MVFRSFVIAGVVALASGCQSDASEICARLDECGLLPKGGVTAADPNGFTRDDCEAQVEREVPDSRREHCANCVSDHQCSEIQTVCLADCKPQ